MPRELRVEHAELLGRRRRAEGVHRAVEERAHELVRRARLGDVGLVDHLDRELRRRLDERRERVGVGLPRGGT